MPVQDEVVPRNRRPVPKAQKRDELLAAAAVLLVTEGYDAASMSRIAEHAGVTPNTLYWYFRDKDELLVAVADRYLQALLNEHASLSDRPLAEQLCWLVERLRPVKHLVATVHNRVAVSDAISAWHTGFHQTFEEIFERQLPGPVPTQRRAAEAAAATFALEGAITHDLDEATTQQLCQLIADRLHHATTADTPPAVPAGSHHAT
jgi:AcrR family transcriptional regulator